MKVMATLVDHYLQEMAESIVEVEESEAAYRAIVARHHAEFGPGILAEQKAATHPALLQAIGDGAYYRSRATMYATAAVAVQMDEQRQRGAA